MTSPLRPGDRLAITARIESHGLVAAECAALTGGTPTIDGVAVCDDTSLIARAAYVRLGVEVLATAGDLGALALAVEAVDRDGLDADRFRIDVHDPLGRAGRPSAEVATVLADRLDHDPDLSEPRRRFLVVLTESSWSFGRVVAATEAGHVPHDAKPWTTSSSLESRFARALVNLVPTATSILDPCCGAGSIVLEAAALGLRAAGVDWKPAMVGMTRENLTHFGYEASVVRADSRDHCEFADAVVTDLPYGNAITGDERIIRAILDQCARSAPAGVFVAPTDISVWLRSAGYRDVEVHTVTKRRGFTRWIHVARSADCPAP